MTFVDPDRRAPRQAQLLLRLRGSWNARGLGGGHPSIHGDRWYELHAADTQVRQRTCLLATQ